MTWINSSWIYYIFLSVLRVWFVYFTHTFIWIFYFLVFLTQIIFFISLSLAFGIRFDYYFFWITILFHKYFIIFLNIFILFLIIKFICLILFFNEIDLSAFIQQLINFLFVFFIFWFLLNILDWKSLIFFLVNILRVIFALYDLNIFFYLRYSITSLTFIFTIVNINIFGAEYSKILDLIFQWQCFPQKLFPFNTVWHPLWIKCTIFFLFWVLSCHI